MRPGHDGPTGRTSVDRRRVATRRRTDQFGPAASAGPTGRSGSAKTARRTRSVCISPPETRAGRLRDQDRADSRCIALCHGGAPIAARQDFVGRADAGCSVDGGALLASRVATLHSSFVEARSCLPSRSLGEGWPVLRSQPWLRRVAPFKGTQRDCAPTTGRRKSVQLLERMSEVERARLRPNRRRPDVVAPANESAPAPSLPAMPGIAIFD